MIDLLLKVLKSLEDVGQKESFLKFMGLLASGTFSLHNICYLLFLDIVGWFSCDSTTHMRYGHETVKFWQIGYRLFHGKFLRFMSGIRNFGQVWDGTSERGFLIRWNLRWTVPYQMGFTSENLITNTAAVVLLWIWVHLFYKRYVQKGAVNWLRLPYFNIIEGFLWHFCLKKGKDKL